MLRTFGRSLVVAGSVAVAGLLGVAATPAKAQGYGFGYPTAGVSINVTRGVYPPAGPYRPGYPTGYGYPRGGGYRCPHHHAPGHHCNHRPPFVVAPVVPAYGWARPVVPVVTPLPW